jgi:hypothetical protein
MLKHFKLYFSEIGRMAFSLQRNSPFPDNFIAVSRQQFCISFIAFVQLGFTVFHYLDAVYEVFNHIATVNFNLHSYPLIAMKSIRSGICTMIEVQLSVKNNIGPRCAKICSWACCSSIATQQVALQ